MIQELSRLAWEGSDLPTFMSILQKLDPILINHQNTRGQTILYCAARNGHVAFVHELLKVQPGHLPLGLLCK